MESQGGKATNSRRSFATLRALPARRVLLFSRNKSLRFFARTLIKTNGQLLNERPPSGQWVVRCQVRSVRPVKSLRALISRSCNGLVKKVRQNSFNRTEVDVTST